MMLLLRRRVAGLLALILGSAGRAVPGRAAGAAIVTVSMRPIAAISPLLYGVNYVWHLVAGVDYRPFADAMSGIAEVTLMRYPGGWAAERFDWANNRQVGGEADPERPGAGPEAFLALAPAASFVTPSAIALRDPARTGEVIGITVDLVRRYGRRVKMWEIGNEWWLQRGARNDPAMREQNLLAYGALVSELAPAMHAVSPEIEIYVTGDWTRPDDFSILRERAGAAAWGVVAGVSLHPYFGNLEPETLFIRLPERVATIRRLTGKQKVFASEWSLGPRVTRDDFGIRNASQMVQAIQTLAIAGIDAAAYWPPVRALPAIAFVSTDYQRPFATGMLFGWMSRYFRGEMLPTGGDLVAVAARSREGVTLFIPGMASLPRTVRIPLAGTGLTRVASSEVMVADDTEDPNRSRVARFVALPTTLRVGADGRSFVEFDINPGTPGRGAAWEIARLTLQG